MDNGVYITLSRQLALFRDMAVTAGNIANANTTGYGAERMLFTSYIAKDKSQGVSNPMAFDHDISTYRDTRTGPMKSTGNQLDVAIEGDAYFSVETPLGTRYTRAGNFQVDGGGVLVTPAGYPVLDNSGQRITFPDDTGSIEIGSVGNMRVNGEDFSTLGIFQFANPQAMKRLGNGLYTSEETPLAAGEEIRIMQGVLENSNVQPVSELTHMIEVSRAVGSTSKFIETMYDLQRKAANTLAQQG